MSHRIHPGRIIKYIILCLIAVISVYPFIWVVFSSLKDNNEIYGHPFAFPKNPYWEHYVEAWKGAAVGKSFTNSMLVCLAAVILLIMTAAMASYILTRVWPSRFMNTFFSLGIMIPLHALLIPAVLIFKLIHMQNNLFSLILIFIAWQMSMSMYIIKGYMQNIPYELDEAAMIDGCSKAQVFFHIVFPVCVPGIATAATLAFLNCWNDLLLGLVIISSPEKRTLTMAISALQGSYATNYGLLCSGFVITIVPVVIMYMIFQKQVISGMTAGAVKG